MIPEGFILVHRKLLESAVWGCRPSTRVVFMTILFRANWKDAVMYHYGEKREIPIKRGQFVTSFRNLAKEANVSIRQIRTAISKLKRLQIITANSTHQSTQITVLNYAQYQDSQTHETTSQRHTSDTRATQIEQGNNNKNVYRYTREPFKPPTPEEASAYAKTLGFELDGDRFVNHYAASGWMRGKSQIKDWRACVRTWKLNGSANEKKFVVDFS